MGITKGISNLFSGESNITGNIKDFGTQTVEKVKKVGEDVYNTGAEQVQSLKNTIQAQQNSTYGKDPVTDSMLESQYINEKDYINENYIEKVGRETGISADIDNIGLKITASYKMLEAPNDDIFNNPNITPEEKIALFNQRRNVGANRINQLRKLQQAKIGEINDLAEVETRKAKAEQEAYKSVLDLQKQQFEERKFGLDVYKAKSSAELNRAKYMSDVEYKNKQLNVSEGRLALDQNKFTTSRLEDQQNYTYKDNQNVSSLLDQISIAEGTHGNYNAIYGKGSQNKIDLTNMTLDELQRFQAQSVYKDKNGNWVGGAMGKYQIVTGTLKDLIKDMGLTGKEKFTPELQDKMAMKLIGNSNQDFIDGKITESQYQDKLSQIWASVPNSKTGQSTYAKDGTNRATEGGKNILGAIRGLRSKEVNYSKVKPNLIRDLDDFSGKKKVDREFVSKLKPVNANEILLQAMNTKNFVLDDYDIEQLQNIKGGTLSEKSAIQKNIYKYKLESTHETIKNMTAEEVVENGQLLGNYGKPNLELKDLIRNLLYSGFDKDLDSGYFSDDNVYNLIQEKSEVYKKELDDLDMDLEDVIDEVQDEMLTMGINITDRNIGSGIGQFLDFSKEHLYTTQAEVDERNIRIKEEAEKQGAYRESMKNK